MKKIFFLLVVLGSFAAPLLSLADTAINSDQGHFLADGDYSYVRGYINGYTLGQHRVPVDLEAYMEGFQGVLDRKPNHQSLLTSEKAEADLDRITARQLAQIAKENQPQVLLFLSTNAQSPTVKSTASGLQYRIIKLGEGVNDTNQNLAVIEYEARNLKGESVQPWPVPQPLTLALDVSKDTMMQGVFEGIKLMRPGAEYEFYLKPELALRDEGRGTIGPGELLIVKVKLLSFKTFH